ncbi:MAG: nucleoid occlusion protein, partial [Eubacterium sp.]|nr:nucleoid occlusion protein [Eubacterium sp.]
RHARALLTCESEEQIWQVLNIVKEKKLNVEQTERYIDALIGNKPKKAKNVVKIFKDIRIFVNTVNKAINTMIEAGIPAESNKTETDEYIEFNIKIPKNAQNSEQTVLSEKEAPQTA